MRILSVFVLAGCLVSSPANAQQDTPPPGKFSPPPTAEEIGREFDAADTNKDGLLDKNEWFRALPDAVKPHANTVWPRFQPTGANSVTKQRYVEVRSQ